MGDLRDLNVVEREAVRFLRDPIDAVQGNAHRTHSLIGAVVDAIRGEAANRGKLAPRVVIQLLNRASNDLRCASMLADVGYSAQAATLCASLMEAVLAAGYVAGDEAAARQWLGHKDARSTFEKVWPMVEARFRDYPKAVAKVYSVYTQLCMVKHVNPLIESKMGAEPGEEGVALTNGPDTSENAIRMSWFAVSQGCRMAALAITPAVDALVPLAEHERLGAGFVEVLEACKELDREAERRWAPEEAASRGEAPSS